MSSLYYFVIIIIHFSKKTKKNCYRCKISVPRFYVLSKKKTSGKIVCINKYICVTSYTARIGTQEQTCIDTTNYPNKFLLNSNSVKYLFLNELLKSFLIININFKV